MKNVSTVWELIYILLLMCAGVVGVVSLVRGNSLYVNYRFTDKSLTEVSSSVEYLIDKNTNEYTVPDMWDATYTTDDIIAIMYIQDDTCPESLYGPMKFKVYDGEYAITDRWSAQKNSYVTHVYTSLYSDMSNPSIRYYILWNADEQNWTLTKRQFKPVFHVGLREWKWEVVH